MIVTAWNRGQHLKTGGGYGFRFNSNDRDQHLSREWRKVRFLVEEPDTWAEANIDKDCFWNDKTTLVNKSIGRWLLHKGYARWAKNEPPTFRLVHLGENLFRVVPEHLPDSLPCHRQLPAREWEEFQKAFSEGRIMEIRQEIRQRCQRLIEQLKDHFRDETTGGIECAACSWMKPGNSFRGDIIQMHHHHPVHEAPDEGRTIRWEEAVKTFSPLCPTCHALIHAKPGGGCYGLEELRNILSIS